MATQRLSLDPAFGSASTTGELATALAEVKRLRQEAEEKAAELDSALERLRELTEADGDQAPPRPVAVRPLHEVVATEDLAPSEAILRATRMAVSGEPRDRIVATLRDEYDVADAGRVAEQILGPEPEAEAKEPEPAPESR